MAENKQLSGPNLAEGLLLTELSDGGMLRCHTAGEEIIVARRGTDYFAIGAQCTHYGAPLAEGILVDETVRCPWHHACFSLRTGEAVRPPALEPVSTWHTTIRDGKLYVHERKPKRNPPAADSRKLPEKVVIIGGGGAGNAAAEMLRREGYCGGVTMISNDGDVPYDRPALSKDFLEGETGEDQLPLHPPNFYSDNEIELVLNRSVTAIDGASQNVNLSDGQLRKFDALLIATGAEPVKLEVPGADLSNVRYLRSWNDCRAILADATKARNVVVAGASFIAMEVAAGLIQRKLKVHIVAPEEIPMASVLGPEVGAFLRQLHESKGVTFHLKQTVAAIEEGQVVLKSGETIPADLVVVGIGVKPRTELAERAGIKMDRGIIVNEYLETNVTGMLAAGDIARWPDPLTGEHIRVEHWVVAERQGPDCRAQYAWAWRAI
jgi:apoptosis-inducing factor 3